MCSLKRKLIMNSTVSSDNDVAHSRQFLASLNWSQQTNVTISPLLIGFSADNGAPQETWEKG